MTRDDAQKSVHHMEEYVAKLRRAGVPIVAGTDGYGMELVRELELYVDGGLTPAEALATATIAPARNVKIDNRTGSIAVGKEADLLLVDGDPSRRIGDLRHVDQVMSDGVLMDGDALRTEAGFSGTAEVAAALPQLVPDLGQQLDLAGPAGRFLALAHQLCRPAHHQENDEGEDEEAHDLGQECAPAEHRRAGLLERRIVGHRAVIVGGDRAKQEEVAGEVEPAEDLADDRHDDVVGEAGDDLGERGADDHGDGKVEHVALGDERAKVIEHGSPSFSSYGQHTPIAGWQPALCCFVRQHIEVKRPRIYVIRPRDPKGTCR